MKFHFLITACFKHDSQQVCKGGSLETSRNVNKQHCLTPQLTSISIPTAFHQCISQSPRNMYLTPCWGSQEVWPHLMIHSHFRSVSSQMWTLELRCDQQVSRCKPHPTIGIFEAWGFAARTVQLNSVNQRKSLRATMFLLIWDIGKMGRSASVRHLLWCLP